ncbi:MAG: A24 family peptidase [Pseudohongiellaceae bacterium]
MFELLAASTPALVATTFIITLLVGSFLNVVIYRLPVMMERQWTEQCSDLLNLDKTALPPGESSHFNLAVPGSHCPACGHKITALENIPLLSYLLQKGKCNACQAHISFRYPLVEATTALLSALVVYNFGFSWLALALLVFTWALIALTAIDIDHQLLPDDITLPLLWLGLLVNSFGLLTSLTNAFWGAVLGYMILWGVYWLFKLVTGKEGMGYGDFKLLAALGAWLGWQALPLVIMLSSIVGALTGISLIIIKGRDKNIPIPFGPYLAAAGFIVLIWGKRITELYTQMILS